MSIEDAIFEVCDPPCSGTWEDDLYGRMRTALLSHGFTHTEMFTDQDGDRLRDALTEDEFDTLLGLLLAVSSRWPAEVGNVSWLLEEEFGHLLEDADQILKDPGSFLPPTFT